jgi:hypothetical protein
MKVDSDFPHLRRMSTICRQIEREAAKDWVYDSSELVCRRKSLRKQSFEEQGARINKPNTLAMRKIGMHGAVTKTQLSKPGVYTL